MASSKKDLLLLFDRPLEPIFMKKGSTENVVFDVPDNYLTDRYQAIGDTIQTRFGEDADRKIPVKSVPIPNLSVPLSIDREECFSLFIPKHRKAAGRLIDVFTGTKDVEELKSVACYTRDRCNPLLFNYALSVAILHRPDTKDLDIPTLAETFPDKFMDSKVLKRVREETTVVPEGSRMPIIIPKDYTASDLEPEHRLWYFREDMGINLHHWHWHLVYPFEADRSIVNKDRRGELNYYMHQQIIARYNIERLCNDLPRVKRLNNFRAPIEEAYFPKIDSLVASRSWPPRVANATLKDLNREMDQLKFDIADMERWRDRIYQAIQQGFVVDANGTSIPLNNTNGVDILGNLMESSILSINRPFYGDFHNLGHVMMSYCHDPDHRFLESFSVMGDPSTTMRDPAFYLFHAYIDDVFHEHKELLPPYTLPELDYQGITVTGIEVKPERGASNTFSTFWQQSDVNLSRGMDFVPRGNVFARITHLQHTPFIYRVNVNNSGNAQRLGTVRIFLGPKFDERGQEMLLRDQRKLMIELDKFTVSMRQGNNIFERRSTESSLTIPFERTFRNVDDNRPAPGTAEEGGFIFCGCGWPQHMLIPKGTQQGYQCQLFVMISNYEDDKIDQDLVGSCNDAIIFCGVRDRRYPDRKPMGYPFDRLPRTGSDRLSNFLTPNMRVSDVKIIHSNTTTVRE